MTQAINAIRRKPFTATLLGIFLLAGVLSFTSFFMQQNAHAGCNSPDGTRVDLEVEFSVDNEDCVIAVGTPVSYTAKVVSNTTRHVFEWEITDADDNSIKKEKDNGGEESTLTYDFPGPGIYSVSVTVWGKPYTNPDTGVTDDPTTCMVTHDFSDVTAVEIVEIVVKPRHNPDGLDWSGSADIAVGAIDSAIHKADVKFKIAPEPPAGCSYSVELPVSLENWEGYNGANNAVLDILSEDGMITFDNVEELGVLTSSNVIRLDGGEAEGPCYIESGDEWCFVNFLPNDYHEEDYWLSSPSFLPEIAGPIVVVAASSGSTEEPSYTAASASTATILQAVKFEFDNAALVGHQIKFAVEKMLVRDGDGSEESFVNPPGGPDGVAPFGSLSPEQAVVDPNGYAYTTLEVHNLPAGTRLLSVTMAAYDQNARKVVAGDDSDPDAIRLTSVPIEYTLYNVDWLPCKPVSVQANRRYFSHYHEGVADGKKLWIRFMVKINPSAVADISNVGVTFELVDGKRHTRPIFQLNPT